MPTHLNRIHNNYVTHKSIIIINVTKGDYQAKELANLLFTIGIPVHLPTRNECYIRIPY